jgi:phage shock protein A
MSIFKRTFTSLYASIDQMVGEIENHDALIDAAIKEQKKKNRRGQSSVAQS